MTISNRIKPLAFTYNQGIEKQTWANGVEALTDALNLEANVTKSIRDVIIKCENVPKFNDYHVRLILR